MNILVSYNWLKEFLHTDLAPEEFARLTTASGNSVERMHVLADRYQKVVVGEVVELREHPNANKLRLAMVDIGKTGSGGIVQIVCGGTNLVVGQKVSVALPGAKVRWHGEENWAELSETEIRGVKSFGMICAAVELGFEKIKQGEREIWDITSLTDAKAGTPLVDALELDDVIFDIEATTNRPDCMSIVGQAREGSAVTEAEFVPPKAVAALTHKLRGEHASLNIRVLESALCPRYQAILIEGISVGPSPWWLQKKLLLAGHRPINNVVDVTNLVLHELGQPLHAFDADKIDGQQIAARHAKKGETIQALDGQEYKLTDDMLVITDAKKPVAIAGVMGGLATGTTEATTRIIIESANFDPVSIRRTSRALNLASDSSKLFEKGLSTEATTPALARAVELILQVAGGKVASQVADERAEVYKPLEFPFDPKRAVELIGVDIPERQMLQILERLGFKVEGMKGSKRLKGLKGYAVTVPYWRDHDIETSIDFVEEIARVYGYANVPAKLPAGEFALIPEDAALVWERRAKAALCGAGLTEAYSYSFVSAAQLERYGLDPEQAVHLQNPLSSDQEFLRTSLVPTLLCVIEANQKMFPEQSLFEIAPVYLPRKNELPEQSLRLVMGFTGTSTGSGSRDGEALFLKAKGALLRFCFEVGVRGVDVARLTNDVHWHPLRSAEILLGKQTFGVIGEVSHAMMDAFGLDVHSVLIDLDFEALIGFCSTSRSFKPLPSYPAVKRDLAFFVDRRAPYKTIEEKLLFTNTLLRDIELFDVYTGKGVPDGQKSLAVHLTFRADDRTLQSAEVDEVMNTLQKMLLDSFSAIIRA